MSDCEIFIVSTEIPKPRKKRGERVKRDSASSQCKYHIPKLELDQNKQVEEVKEPEVILP